MKYSTKVLGVAPRRSPDGCGGIVPGADAVVGATAESHPHSSVPLAVCQEAGAIYLHAWENRYLDLACSVSAAGDPTVEARYPDYRHTADFGGRTSAGCDFGGEFPERLDVVGAGSVTLDPRVDGHCVTTAIDGVPLPQDETEVVTERVRTACAPGFHRDGQVGLVELRLEAPVGSEAGRCDARIDRQAREIHLEPRARLTSASREEELWVSRGPRHSLPSVSGGDVLCSAALRPLVDAKHRAKAESMSVAA